MDKVYATKGVVTNYGEGGGLQNWRGGQVEFTPTKKGGGRISFSHAVGGGGGGGTHFFRVVLTRELKVLAILMGETTRFHS